MEMMEGYQGGNASAQMLSSLICTDNNKESFFRWGFDIFAFGFILKPVKSRVSGPEKSKVTKNVTKVTKKIDSRKGKELEFCTRGMVLAFFIEKTGEGSTFQHSMVWRRTVSVLA